MPRKPLRPVIFQHIRTGRIITAPSITEFARKARLGVYGRYQFDDVLKGKKLQLHGWGLPETLNQRLQLKDVFGNQYEATVAELYNRRKLSATALNRLRRGQPFQSIAPASHDFGAVLPPKTYRVKEYAVRKGRRVYRGRYLHEVADQIGVSTGGLCCLVHGLYPSLRGFTLHSVKTESRRAFTL